MRKRVNDTVYATGHKIQLYYLCGDNVLYLIENKANYSKVITLRSLGDSEVPQTTTKLQSYTVSAR
jgi:hypothetical protein